MAVLLMPPLSIQFIDSSGVPLAFGEVYTAKAGTTAGPGQAYPQATYTDSTETTTNTNPIVLDAAGSATLWLDGYYSVAVYNAAGSLVRSADNVSSSSSLNPLVLQQALYTTANAGGSSDAITAAFTPAITTTTLASGNTFLAVRAGFANTTTTPTFTPNSGALLPKTIVKINNQALSIGDISGAGFWMQLQYDSTLGVWVLLNPATGQGPLVLQQALYTTANAGGSSDAITAAFTPAITTTTLASGNTFLAVRAGFANTTTTPTFTPNSGALLPKTIVKINNQALSIGDISGAGFWMQLQYDSTLGVWVLLNPATGGGQGPPVVGTTRNLRASVTAASTSITFQADEVILETALGGTAYKIANLNKTLNMAGGPGAGYMDTGAAGPVSGFCAIYAIYNPTTQTVALLGYNATSANAPNVYGGANMPSGYTASALLGVWPTNASSQFKTGYQADRYLSLAMTSILGSTTNQGSYTSLSMSAAVPLNAKFFTSVLNVSDSGLVAGVRQLVVAGDANGTGAGYLSVEGVSSSGGYGAGTPAPVPIITPQTTFYTSSSPATTNYNIYVVGYSI